jgi:hypothetical protein
MYGAKPSEEIEGIATRRERASATKACAVSWLRLPTRNANTRRLDASSAVKVYASPTFAASSFAGSTRFCFFFYEGPDLIELHQRARQVPHARVVEVLGTVTEREREAAHGHAMHVGHALDHALTVAVHERREHAQALLRRKEELVDDDGFEVFQARTWTTKPAAPLPMDGLWNTGDQRS